MFDTNGSATVGAAATVSKVTIRTVIIGTTNVCNASCVHCPTGKQETDHLLRGSMPMDLFRSIIDQIKAECTVTGWFAIGLFGDSLLDPDIVERARYIKAALPGVLLSFNTNCATYSPDKHAVLPAASTRSISTSSRCGPAFTAPSCGRSGSKGSGRKSRRIRDFGSKITAGIPLHRLNVDELVAAMGFS